MKRKHGVTICLNLTYRCTAGCRWCHCGCDFLSGSGTDLTLDQVREFCDFVGSRLVRNFRVAGGEPTLVSHLGEACELIASRLTFVGLSPHISTNGMNPMPALPRGWHYRIDPVSAKRGVHRPVWWSPVDLGLDPAGYRCMMPHTCGVGYDYRGWTFCQISTQLGRMLGIDARTTGPDDPPKQEICRHCWYSVPLSVWDKIGQQILNHEIEIPTPIWKGVKERHPHGRVPHKKAR